MKLNQTCFVCIPIECGIRLIAVLTILRAISMTISLIISTAEISAQVMFWPFIAVYSILSVLFVIALICSTEFNRKMLLIAWLVLEVLCANLYYFILIKNGTLMNALCRETLLNQINEITGQDEQITTEDCMTGGKIMIITDLAITWICDVYFFVVLFRWHMIKNGEEYVRSRAESAK